MVRGKKKLEKVGGDLQHDNTTNELTDDQRQVLFFNHLRKIETLKDKLATVNSDLRNAYKVAKAEGFIKKEFDFAFWLEKDEGEAAVAERKRQAEIAAWMGVPLGTQADLFSGEAAPSIAEKAYEDGKRSGIKNEVLKPPHGSGTEAYNEYVRGWHDGAAVRTTTLREQEEGAQLLRPAENTTDAPDELDDAATAAFDIGDPDGAVDAGEAWPDDAAISAREPAEVL